VVQLLKELALLEELELKNVREIVSANTSKS
jgi:hypothetical protein